MQHIIVSSFHVPFVIIYIVLQSRSFIGERICVFAPRGKFKTQILPKLNGADLVPTP